VWRSSIKRFNIRVAHCIPCSDETFKHRPSKYCPCAACRAVHAPTGTCNHSSIFFLMSSRLSDVRIVAIGRRRCRSVARPRHNVDGGKANTRLLSGKAGFKATECDLRKAPCKFLPTKRLSVALHRRQAANDLIIMVTPPTRTVLIFVTRDAEMKKTYDATHRRDLFTFCASKQDHSSQRCLEICFRSTEMSTEMQNEFSEGKRGTLGVGCSNDNTHNTRHEAAQQDTLRTRAALSLCVPLCPVVVLLVSLDIIPYVPVYFVGRKLSFFIGKRHTFSQYCKKVPRQWRP